MKILSSLKAIDIFLGIIIFPTFEQYVVALRMVHSGAETWGCDLSFEHPQSQYYLKIGLRASHRRLRREVTLVESDISFGINHDGDQWWF